MARFDRQIATAKRLIAKNGRTVQITIRKSEPNPDKPWEVSTTEETHDVQIAFLPLTKQSFESITKMQATEVPKGAVQGLMGQVPFEVDLTATVLRDGKTLAVHYMDVLSPNGQKILFTMVLGE